MSTSTVALPSDLALSLDLIAQHAQLCLSAAQQKEADQAFVRQSGLPSLVLMEQAASGISQKILELMEKDQIEKGQGEVARLLILAGGGNNGGDALAVGRQLFALTDRRFPLELTIYLVSPKPLQGDALAQYQALLADPKLKACLVDWKKGGDELREYLQQGGKTYILDGIFGSGFKASRPMDPEIVRMIETIQEARAQRGQITVVAVDLPTGLEASGCRRGEAVLKADLTLTMSGPKASLLLDPNFMDVGKVETVPISMHQSFLADTIQKPVQAKAEPPLYWPQASCGQAILRHFATPANMHKLSFAKSLLIGGDAGMVGALVLAARASLALGCPYLTIKAMDEGVATKTLLAELLPEALTLREAPSLSTNPTLPEDSTLPEALTLSESWDPDLYQAIAIGPGLGTGQTARDLLRKVLLSSAVLVCDADALNLLASDQGLMELLISRGKEGKVSILTPHWGEYRRLVQCLSTDQSEQQVVEQVEEATLDPVRGTEAAPIDAKEMDSVKTAQLDPVKAARALSQACQAIVYLKSARPILVEPWTLSAQLLTYGSKKLAKAGSGDTLTGSILACLSQGIPPLLAVTLAALLQGFGSQRGGPDFRISDLPALMAEVKAEWEEGLG